MTDDEKLPWDMTDGALAKPFGEPVCIVPKSQARALYRGAKLILSCDWCGMLEGCQNEDFVDKYNEALALLKKGLGLDDEKACPSGGEHEWLESNPRIIHKTQFVCIKCGAEK